MELDPALVGSVLLDAGLTESPSPPLRTLETPELTPTLLDPVLRLVGLLNAAEDFGFLARRSCARSCTGLRRADRRRASRRIAGHGGSVERVIRAAEWLRANYDRPMSIEMLARECGLGASALHHRFKDVTAVNPLQYQKRLRLQEARRLMAGEGLDAAEAGFRVGYADVSQFSREYRRLFGLPPRRRVAELFRTLGGNEGEAGEAGGFPPDNDASPSDPTRGLRSRPAFQGEPGGDPMRADPAASPSPAIYSSRRTA